MSWLWEEQTVMEKVCVVYKAGTDYTGSVSAQLMD